jgi:hypothetical protein
MVRAIPTAMRDAILSGFYAPAVLVQVDWPDGAVRVHNGTAPIEWNDAEWLAVGALGFVQLPPATRGIGQESGALLVGGDLPELSEMLAVDASGVRVRVWVGVFTDRQGTALLADPVLEWQGRIADQAFEQADSGVVTDNQVRFELLSAVNQMSTGAAQYSHEDQIQIDPTDTALLHIKAALAKSQQAQVAG